MDDKAFIAKYVADETHRIHEALRSMVTAPSVPSAAEKKALIDDMKATVSRLQSALLHLCSEVEKNKEHAAAPSGNMREPVN